MPAHDNRLKPEEKARFFRIWFSMLDWVNEKKNVVPGVKPPYAVRDAVAIRDVVWADDRLRHAWIDANPDGLPPEDLTMARSWDHRVAAHFTLAKHFAGYSLFLASGGRAFAVLGLSDSLADLVPAVPTYVNAVLLPYEDRIVYDGFLVGYAISLGPGIRRGITDEIRRVKERNAILTSLTATPQPNPIDTVKNRKKANESVVKHFARHLSSEGHSEAVRVRDVEVAEWIGEHLPEGRTLASLQPPDVQLALSTDTRPPVPRPQALTALKRFTIFLAQTERMTWEDADDLHAWLRAQGRRRQ